MRKALRQTWCVVAGSPVTGHRSFSQPRYTPGIIAALKQLGLEDLALGLEPVGGAHQFWNLLSLECNLHGAFDRLDLWFGGTDEVRDSETLSQC